MKKLTSQSSDATFVPDELPSEAAVASLVEGLVDEPRDPVDGLLERLAAGDSAAALLDGWAGPQAWPAGRWRAMLAGQMSLEELEAAKHQAKRAFARSASGPRAGAAGGPGGRDEAADAATGGDEQAGEAGALLAYLLTLAVGRVQLDQWLTALPRETVEDWWTAIGGVADEPVAGWLLRAAG